MCNVYFVLVASSLFYFYLCAYTYTIRPMQHKEPGYVYILTNPSFREDWVKIGKSSRPVDVRSKELDNTAVPLPFVGTFMPEEQRNTSGAYQGAKYFAYQGKILDNIRKEREEV